MSLRDTARELVADSAAEAARKGHERNYEKLHIHRDGSVSWFESINRTDDLIDRQADGFEAIPSVGTFGTGGYACNCDYCDDSGYASIDDAISDAIGDSDDLRDVEEAMLAAFDGIEVGYFDDEEDAIAEDPRDAAEAACAVYSPSAGE